MNRHKKKMAEQFLNHALGIIYLLTGEEYTIVKKNSSRSSIHRLTGEVPIKCDDVAVYFSMDEWEFIEGQNEMYKDTMKEKENRPLKTVAAESSDLTGQCCENVQAEEEEREKLPQGETHSDLCTDLTGECENLQTEEEERNEIPQMETHSDLCTGEDTDVLNTVQHEDLCARSPQEISDSIDPGSIIARAGSTMGPRGSNRPRQHLTRGSASVAESVTVRPRPVLSSVSVGEVASSQQHNLVMHKDTEPVRGDIQEFQENLFTVLVKEESEDSQQTENHSDLYADVSTHQFSGEESHMIACSLTGINEDEPNLHMKTEVENSETNPLKRSKFPDYGLLNSTVEYTCDQKEMIVNDYSDVICGTRLFNPLQITESDKLANTISEFDKRQVSLTEGTYEKSYTNKRPSSSHRGKKLLVCYECKKVFTKRSVLIIHQRTHTGEKPFICRMCGKGFAERSSLNRHHRTHTGERPNICSTCGKAFSERSNLIRHQLTHTRER